MAGIFLGIGLEYVDAVFTTIKNSDFSQYTITGMKTLAILFFLINILKKYNEGVANNDGYTWGLTPTELAKNFAVVILVIFSTQVLGVFDSILVAIETQYRDTAPVLLPLQMQDVDLEQDVSALEAASKAMSLLYEALVTPLFGLKVIAFIIGLFLWLLDLFIYPLFLAERYFLLGIMQAFFPLVIQKSSRGLIKTIHLGGFPLADYSGFICRPEYETEVSKSISTLIKDNLKWDRFRLDDIIGDRLELVSRFFPGDRYHFEQRYSTPCPYISLPGSFEEYLESLGRSTRRTIRRRKRDIQMVEGYRVSDASQDDLDLHIDIILKLWRDRWGLEPEEFRSLFHRCFNNDCLWLRVLWLSDIPIAAL